MQKRVWQDEHLKSYQNGFCDCEKSAIFEFLSLDKALDIISSGVYYELFSNDDLLELNRYAVLKNLQADVKDLTLKSIRPDLAQKAMEEFGLNGKVVIDLKEMIAQELFSKQTRNGKLRQLVKNLSATKILPCLYIDDLLNFSEAELSYACSLTSELDCLLYINFLQTLDQAGSLDKLYNKSPARVIEDFGLLDRRTYLLGCNFLDKDDALVLSGYDSHILISPLADMLLGRGAINLVMLFESGLDVKLCSNEYPFIDMLHEGKIACGNTANLMYDPFAVSIQQMEDMIASDKDVDELLTEVRLNKQKEKVKEIFRRIK